jgi:hypothetical protein
MFTRLHPFQELVTFGIGKVLAKGTRDIELRLLKSDEGTTDVVLHDVVYVPGLTANLISNYALNLR